MPPADRLTVLDDAFLALDTPDAPLHVGWTILIDGAPPALSTLRRHLQSRMDRVPRFRRRLVTTALAGGEVRWEDDVGFDIGKHVFTVSVAPPGAQEDVRRLAGRLLSTPLPLDRPLWRVYLVMGLADGFAVVGQAHHALIDGIAAMEVAALLFDAEPQPQPDAARAWSPERKTAASAAVSLTKERMLMGATRGVQLARSGGRSAAQAREIVLHAASRRPTSGTVGPGVGKTVSALTDILRPAAPVGLTRTVGRDRELGLAALDLELLRTIAKARGATINDVFLASVAHALGHALDRRDEAPTRLKAMMPVNVRTGDPGALGNALSFVFVDLPCDEADPATGLSQVVAETRRVKSADLASTLTGIVRLADLVPTMARRAISRMIAATTHFNVTISNVPGPEIPLYLLGQHVRAVYPAVPMWHGQGLSIGALSYCGRMHICVFADRGVIPDAAQIAADIARAAGMLAGEEEHPESIETIRRRLPVTDATPWRRRARSRRAHGHSTRSA